MTYRVDRVIRISVFALVFTCAASVGNAQAVPRVPQQSVGSQLKFDIRQVAKNIGHDQLRIFESPVRDVAAKPKNVIYLLPFVVAGALIPADRHIEPTPSPGAQNTAQHISDVGLIGTTIGGLYIYGLVKHNEHAHEAGVLGTESFADTYLIKELANVLSGRLRPNEGNGHGDFFVNHSLDSSFPSGHASLTWSMATVMADEYPSNKSRLFWYAVGSTVAATRVIGRKHFTSDVIVGSAMGYLIGRYVFHAHHHY